VSQISMPIRILLVGAVVFLAAWFTVLKPKETVIPPSPAASAPAPAASSAKPKAGAKSKAGSFRATAKAGAATAEKDALGAANAGIEDDAPAPAAAAPSATSATSAAPSATAARPARPAVAPVPDAAVAKLPRDVREGLKERKVVVLGVLSTETKPWRQMADDDRAVRSALRDVNRYGGNVVVENVTIGSLVKYDGMLEALKVTQSPTVVVIDRERKAVALTGYLDRLSINQAIADARRFSTTVRIKDSYLAKLNRVCGHYDMRVGRFSLPTVRGGERAGLARLVELNGSYRASIARVAAPARWRGLRAQMLGVLDRNARFNRQLMKAMRGGAAPSASVIAGNAAALAALDRRFNAVGLTDCAVRRTA